MENLNLNLLKYFYYVAYYKGFTNASRKLNIVQSTFSYNVKILEDTMKKILIVRNSKDFELTEEGYQLYEVLKSIFGILEKNLDFSTNDNLYQELSIGVRHSLSDFIFRNALIEFINDNPNIHLSINLYSKVDLKKFNEEYDIIIDYEDYIDLIDISNKESICEIDNIFVCGKELYQKYKNITSVKELNNEKFISLRPNKKKGKINSFCFENNLTFKEIISVNDSIINKEMIKNNFGFSIINKNSVKDELANNTIKQITIKEKIFKDKIILAYKDNKKIKIINEFIKILKKQYSREN